MPIQGREPLHSLVCAHYFLQFELEPLIHTGNPSFGELPATFLGISTPFLLSFLIPPLLSSFLFSLFLLCSFLFLFSLLLRILILSRQVTVHQFHTLKFSFHSRTIYNRPYHSQRQDVNNARKEKKKNIGKKFRKYFLEMFRLYF